MTISAFQKTILDWYEKNKRDLPWRSTRDPYKILVSEIMLQQTQVARVLPKYRLFLKEFPTLETLATTPDARLLAVWSGLGYWRRAKFLKQTVIEITKNHNGQFPKTPAELQRLPGIGPYTAGAVACFAFGNREAFIDTNIRRVYLHFFFTNKQNISDKEILPIAQTAINGLEGSRLAKFEAAPSIRPSRRNTTSREYAQVITRKLAKPSGEAAGNLRPRRDLSAVSVSIRDWHWALFDYGTTVLKDKKINQRSKHYTKQPKFEGSFRSFRATTIKHLLAQPQKQLSADVLLDFLEDKLRTAKKDWSAQEVLDALVKDKIIYQQKNLYKL